jgi:hypothetical protein
MSFTITNAEDLARITHAAMPSTTKAATPCQGHAVETAKRENAETKKAASALAEKAAASQTTAAASDAATPKAETSVPAQDSTKTVDDAKALTMKIVADKGRDTAVELLKKYGVPVAAKLPADQVAAFCTDAEAVLAS